MNNRPHGGDLRRGRWSEHARVYHVTTVTQDRQAVFAELGPARIVVRCLRQSDEDGWTKTWAYVLMPDHLHWLMALQRGDLSHVVGAVKAVSAHRIGRGLWQAGFHDHALRREEDLRTVARYIVANPVRAGIVDSVMQYPHWDAAWL